MNRSSNAVGTLAAEKQRLVIKLGGDVIASHASLRSVAANIAELWNANWQITVLHGGGPQVSEQQRKLGLQPTKVAGRRITSVDDLNVIKQILCGELNVNLVSALQAQGVDALGCNGASARLIRATHRPPMQVDGETQPVDFGEVGDVDTINTALINNLCNEGVLPVIASIGADTTGRVFNINADTTACAMAAALKADMLILVSEVGAVFQNIQDPSSRYKRLSLADIEACFQAGIITDGMIPKLREAAALVKNTHTQVSVCNLNSEGSLLELANRTLRYGTLLHKGES